MNKNHFQRIGTFALAMLLSISLQSLQCRGQEKMTIQTQVVRPSAPPDTLQKPSTAPSEKPAVPQKEEIWCCIQEKMPRFPGGDKALEKFIKENLHCPEEVLKAGVHGRVVASFCVEKDGSISEPKIVGNILKDKSDSLCTDSVLIKLCEQEALRVVKMMPRWEPGEQNGIPVRVKYNVPFTFNKNATKPKELTK